MADDLMELLANTDLGAGEENEVEDLLEIDSPLATSIKWNEAPKGKPMMESYMDSLGNPTVGWGHLLPEGTPTGIPYDEKMVKKFLQDDIAQAKEDFDLLPLSKRAKARLTPDQKDVIVEMIFNMGLPKYMGIPPHKGFKEMLKAVEAGDINKAAKEMLKSDWAKQVKSRAPRLQKKFLGGKR